MSDFCFENNFNPDFNYDLSLENGEFKTDDSLKTAILISLFTDVKSELSELSQIQTSQKGYWGDVFFEENTGSKIWLLEGSKATNETLNRAKEYALESLAWLIEDGIAEDIIVNTSYDSHKKLCLDIEILKNKNAIEKISIDNVWSYL